MQRKTCSDKSIILLGSIMKSKLDVTSNSFPTLDLLQKSNIILLKRFVNALCDSL